MKYRFIGGSEHGRLRVLQHGNSHYIRVPVQDSYKWGSLVEEPSARVSFHEECYERRRVELGEFVRVYVMALVGMGEAECMRRVADIVEGV